MTNATDRIRNIAAKHLGVSRDTITEESTFDSLGADSLDKIELLMAVEEEFGIEIDESISDRWTTVGEVETYVTEHAEQ